MGLHRADDYFPWHAADDPSYAPGADSGFVESRGVAVLDADGNLLNDWVCYDAAGPVEAVQKSVSAFAADFNTGSSRSSSVALFVENTGTTAINGFEVRYYYRRDSADTEVDLYYSPFAEMSIEDAGGDLGFVSFLYKSTVLNPGEKSDFGSGVRFELHSPGWTANFNAANDPSHFGLDNSGFRLADSILVLDLTGNLLWGAVPQPAFGTADQVEYAEDLIRVEGNLVYVEIPEDGTYVLQTVNAAGVPLSTLFRGSWDEGTQSVDISNGTFAPGSYLVLRQGTRILSWKLFK